MTKAEFECALGATLKAGGIEHFTPREVCNTERAVISGGKRITLEQAPCELWPNIVTTLTVLEWLRAECGDKPVHVNSAYRDPAYNAAVKSTPGSLHVSFSAVDFWIDGFSPRALAEKLAGHPDADQFGIGAYAGFVHLDTRGTLGRPAPARWGEGPNHSWWKKAA